MAVMVANSGSASVKLHKKKSSARTFANSTLGRGAAASGGATAGRTGHRVRAVLH